jgi:MerR family transcriptional regulator, redox-sensitive transcriptional activator SoxR
LEGFEVAVETADDAAGPPQPAEAMTIGDVARRAGVATSALRFYESEGLIESQRNAGGQRRFHRDVLRRIAFIQAAQRVGIGLAEIAEALSMLPDRRVPTAADWARLADGWHARLSERIRLLERLRDDLDSCIGCGCLSLQRCRLYNPDDGAHRLGPGARYLLGHTADDVRALPPR